MKSFYRKQEPEVRVFKDIDDKLMAGVFSQVCLKGEATIRVNKWKRSTWLEQVWLKEFRNFFTELRVQMKIGIPNFFQPDFLRCSCVFWKVSQIPLQK